MKTYSWNRNAAHHRIAITRFAAYSLIFSCLVASLFLIGMGMWSDNSRQYVVTTAAVCLVALLLSWACMFWTMCAMYVWVNEEGRNSPTLPKEKQAEVWYQEGSGWKKLPIGGKGGGEVSTRVDTFKKR